MSIDSHRIATKVSEHPAFGYVESVLNINIAVSHTRRCTVSLDGTEKKILEKQ